MATITTLEKPAAPQPLDGYDPGRNYCELKGSAEHRNRHLAALWRRLQLLELGKLRERAGDAERELFTLGITFTVYSDRSAIDRILPFDLIPRVITASDWRKLDRGIKQRIKALNLFLWDVYHERKILKDGVLPADLVLGNANFRPEMVGYDPPCGTYIHIAGTDIIRDPKGDFYVLEDNARTPSGVSYVVENRHLMQRAFPDLMQGFAIQSVSEYGEQLCGKLIEAAPAGVSDPNIVLLSPGVFNSAYFEHVFLAREIGIPLVEGRDLFVDDDKVFMKTVSGPSPVHVIYRRLNDDFLDPEVFRPESILGVKGLMRAVKKGSVTLANAVGTGVCDDKAVYAYLPRIIRYYLGEDPVLPIVETHICREPGRAGLHPGKYGQAGGEARGRIRRLWHLRRAKGEQGRDRAGPQAIEGGSVELYQPADDRAFGLSNADGGWCRAAPCGPSALRRHRQGNLASARRSHARGLAQEFHHREFEPGRRHERHLGLEGGLR